ncbi:hypothetical protein E0Z10_g6419 [Xylaria hypoxylon]|uniref:Uncharacterized protein n=1 Tax=Xylaria hypoxylon TaxID=37992 RepID=A0A4Z0Z126_9PEZI|nr:hypothetical protein E0Z10_g6419 [Xylaria hypoxylon]
MAFHSQKSPLAPSPISYALRVSLVLLIVNAIIQISFASSCISWLNALGHKTFQFFAYGSRHHLSGLPESLLITHVYTSNIAAIVALIIGLWGGLSLWLRNLTQYRTGGFTKFSRYFYYLWVSFNIPSLLLTNAALIYVFAITNSQDGPNIDRDLAVDLNGSSYTRDTWTPQSWLEAVLRLKLLRDRVYTEQWLHLINAWQYNLIARE